MLLNLLGSLPIYLLFVNIVLHKIWGYTLFLFKKMLRSLWTVSRKSFLRQTSTIPVYY